MSTANAIGNGPDSLGGSGRLNDLWRLEGGDSGGSAAPGRWRRLGGSPANKMSVYNQIRQRRVGTWPGTREGHAVSAGDGNASWLFGGIGYVATGGIRKLDRKIRSTTGPSSPNPVFRVSVCAVRTLIATEKKKGHCIAEVKSDYAQSVGHARRKGA